MDSEKWSKRAMTPTAFGIFAILVASLLWLRKSKWRPWLELVIFFWGASIGFGGLGIALFKHATETGACWGWGSLISHWPNGDTRESLLWHSAPMVLAVAVAIHWWWRFKAWNREDKNHG